MSPVKMSESLRDLLTLISLLHSGVGWEQPTESVALVQMMMDFRAQQLAPLDN